MQTVEGLNAGAQGGFLESRRRERRDSAREKSRSGVPRLFNLQKHYLLAREAMPNSSSCSEKPGAQENQAARLRNGRRRCSCFQDGSAIGCCAETAVYVQETEDVGPSWDAAGQAQQRVEARIRIAGEGVNAEVGLVDEKSG